MTIKIGINGFGRMGKLGFRAGWDNPAFEIVHINEIKGDDRLDNLTTACSWCNVLKSGWPLTYAEHMHAIDTYAHIPPHQYSNSYHIYGLSMKP